MSDSQMNLKPTILLVDDSEDDLFMMRMAFKKAASNCFVLREAGNGEEAIAYISGEGKYADRLEFPYPTVMLIDLNMPLKDGFEVLAWLHSQPQLKRISVIVLSASSRPEDVERAYQLGANSYLVKPTTIESLVALIGCLLQWLGYNHFPPRNAAVRR